LQCPGELLNLWPPYHTLPSLSLNIDCVQPQPVLFDDTVNATIATSPDRLSRVLPRTAVAHCEEEIHNKLFKELLITFFYLPQQVSGQFFANLLITKRYVLLWRYLVNL